MKQINTLSWICLVLSISSCANSQSDNKSEEKDSVVTTVNTLGLPKPYETKSAINFSKVIGWPAGKQPKAPRGFTVSKFADGMRSARWIYQLPNGDILVSQANTEPKGLKKVESVVSGQSQSAHTTGSPNQITLLRDANKDGAPELQEVFLAGLNKPFGMLLIGNTFYVACTDGMWKYPYKTGETRLSGEGKKILDLPEGGYNNHWTRNILANKNNSKIYITVGSGSNVGEHGMDNEVRRANILEINPDGSGERIYASGLRNPVGMGWAPGTDVLWTAVNERDELGNDLVPDYMTSVKEGGFYGWPYSYYGKNLDPRIKEKDQNPGLVNKAIVPDVPLDSHTASLGLAFYTNHMFPEKYQGGVFIGQHGSWNRKDLTGYRVAFVPFKNGIAAGPPEDFLTGFIANREKSEVYGRPVGVTVLQDGSLLVADDASDVLWRVTYKN